MRFDTKMVVLWFILLSSFIVSLVLLVVLPSYPMVVFTLIPCLAVSIVGLLIQSIVVVFSDGIA